MPSHRRHPLPRLSDPTDPTDPTVQALTLFADHLYREIRTRNPEVEEHRPLSEDVDLIERKVYDSLWDTFTFDDLMAAAENEGVPAKVYAAQLEAWIYRYFVRPLGSGLFRKSHPALGDVTGKVFLYRFTDGTHHLA